MKIACISDLHGFLPEIPKDIDLILIAGDLCWEKTIAKEELWLRTKFEPWLLTHNINTIAIAGNHDFYLEKYQKFGNKCTFLQNSQTRVACTGYNPIKIFGTPLSLEVGEWAYQAKEEDIFRVVANLETHILISHGPAYGILDEVLPFYESVGSTVLRNYIEMHQPKLLLHGHIHESRGVRKIGNTYVINASIVDRQYRQQGKIYVVDWNSGPMRNEVNYVREWNCLTKTYSPVI
jgi:Icc-related predicted phosphoesterase